MGTTANQINEFWCFTKYEVFNLQKIQKPFFINLCFNLVYDVLNKLIKTVKN